MPVLNNKQSIVSYWEKVQDGIYEAFKDLGADPNAKDACRYLRNPYQPNAVNTKYPDRPCVELKYVGEKTTLKDLYEPLKKSGFIKLKGTHREQKSPGERDKVPFRVSMGRLVNFLKENPNWEGTHKELFAMLDIAERTGCQLLKWLKERELKVERVRVGRTWKSRQDLEESVLC